MKVIGIILTVIAGLIGLNVVVRFGIVPAIGRSWSWADHGIVLIVGVVGALLLYKLGDWLTKKAKKRTQQTDNSK